MRCIQQTHARCLPLGGMRLITEVVTPARRVATISRRIVRLARTWPKVFSHIAEPLLIVTVISQSHITNQTLFSTHQDGCVGSWGNDSDDYSTSHGTTWFFLVSEFNMVFLLTKLHFIGKQQNQVIHIFHHHHWSTSVEFTSGIRKKQFDLLNHSSGQTIGAAQFISKLCTFLLLSTVIRISVKITWAILESNQHEAHQC